MGAENAGPDMKYFQYSGYFDWPGLYKVITSYPKNKEYKIFETLYKDKSGKGITEREIKLYFEKKVGRMHKYILDFEIRMWDCAKVEVTKNGTKQQLERGRLKIAISAKVDDDFQKLFGDGGFWEKLKPLYMNITGMQTGMQHHDNLHSERYEYLNKIKSFLDTETVD